MRLLHPGSLLLSGICALVLTASSALAARPELDLATERRPAPAAQASLRRVQSDAALTRFGTVAHLDDRYGVPSFVWATRSGGDPRPGGAARPSAEQAARDHLSRLGAFYRLDDADVRGARLQQVHDTGRGGIIVSFDQAIDGVEVFRDEVKVLMDRNLDLVAISGYIPGKAEAGRAASRAFRIPEPAAIGLALDDFTQGTFDRGAIRRTGSAPGGYDRFAIGVEGRALPAGLDASEPVRAKRVLFHLPDQLVPAYYLELMTDAEPTSYVISAQDGGVLFRHSLMESDSYTYRVWADGSGLKAPFDGPQGTSPTPHPTGLADNFNPPFVPSALITLQNGPISTNDPWLPPAATETNGNNADAYVDLASPDGFSAGDFRASTTSPNTFDRTYDLSQAPSVSATQQMAAITQLFYDNNYLHDWYYDVGFNEAARNAQTSNYGRGGVEGDNIRAEAQDFSGTNNANMSTPADGGRPRMQMYVWPRNGQIVTVNSPGGIAGNKTAGTADFGPQTFNTTADVVLVNDGTGTATDGCEAIVNSVAGKIALIDRGTCGFINKVNNAQLAGAVGVIIANNVAAVSNMTGTGFTITIPSLMVSLSDGNDIKNALLSGTVNATLLRGTFSRDGTIDNQIVAHEWGHYISNRLIGNAAGLTNTQGRGMGEGWGDFNALLLTVRPEDAAVPSNANFSGVYPAAGYAVDNAIAPGNEYYFGLRRYPYSTDLSKNPLTYKHIQSGVALPAGPPINANGVDNSEVHNTGEVWCSMLWECYASLLRDTGRLTFDQARDRMRTYLVAGFKLTPNAPTFLEARDALLAAVYAADPTDHQLFCAAFAKRGCGIGAIGPDRNSTNNVGVTESYVCGGDLAFVSATLDDSVHPCDSDGYLDVGEVGYFTVTLKNVGSTSLSSSTANLQLLSSGLTFPSGNTLSFPATQPFATTTARAYVRLDASASSTSIRTVFTDPGFAVAGSHSADYSIRSDADEVPSGSETVEARVPTWTMSGVGTDPWRRLELDPVTHQFFGPDAGGMGDQVLVSPPLQVDAGTFSFQYQNAWSFETSGGTFWDGGVVEITDNGGGTWTDIGSLASPTYGGTITTTSGNPLGGRPGFVAASAGYPSLVTTTFNLGTTYAGKTVQIRFRIGTDAATSGPGWFIDNLTFTGLLNTPFLGVITDPGPCVVAVGDALPGELSFALSGANPVSGKAAFRFALPKAAQVRITIHDVSGRRVATVAEGAYEAGIHSAAWSTAAKPGVYFARMTANGQEMRQRVVVLAR